MIVVNNDLLFDNKMMKSIVVGMHQIVSHGDVAAAPPPTICLNSFLRFYLALTPSRDPLLLSNMGPTAAQEEEEEEKETEMSGGAGGAVAEALLQVVAEVSALPESRGPLRQMCFDLARRVKLLAPLFDELRDDAVSLGPAELRGLKSLCASLVGAKETLRSVNDGSRLYQVTAIASKLQLPLC